MVAVEEGLRPKGACMNYSLPIMIPVAMERVWHYVTRWYYKKRSPFLAWLWGVRHGSNVLFQGKTWIRTRRRGEIVLGDNVIFNSERDTNLVGLINPTILDTRWGGRITIGSRTGASSVVVSSRSSISVGERCKIGGNVRIFDHDFHSLDPQIRCTSADMDNIRSKPIEIGDDCFIGTNSIILKGTNIGARSIVAAGSVVFGLSIPPDSLVKGNPAQIIG